MSSGVLRKQYTALAGLADELGVTFNTPDGSFNQKFCDLCRIMIEDAGGTFTPVKGGSFLFRKAAYLRQLATALSLDPERGTSSSAIFLKAAKAIWDNANDGTAPDVGAKYDWRVYQYLLHAIGSISPCGFTALWDSEGELILDANGQPIYTVEGECPYKISEPSAGWTRTFNPNTATIGELFDAIATLVHDYVGIETPTWTVTEPTGGWLRVYDPNTATTQQLADVVATLANDFRFSQEYYFTEAPTTDVYIYNPATSSEGDAYDVIATLIGDLQTYSVVGELGAELVIEGDFSDGGVAWSVEGESTVNTGVGRIYSSAGAGSSIRQNDSITIGLTYITTYYCTDTDGGSFKSDELGIGAMTPVLGVNSYVGVAAATDIAFSRNGITDISIDNVSVREVIQSV